MGHATCGVGVGAIPGPGEVADMVRVPVTTANTTSKALATLLCLRFTGIANAPRSVCLIQFLVSG